MEMWVTTGGIIFKYFNFILYLDFCGIFQSVSQEEEKGVHWIFLLECHNFLKFIHGWSLSQVSLVETAAFVKKKFWPLLSV